MISQNEIRRRATTFASEWSAETDEHAQAKTFWDEFFQIFGVSRRRVASFEHHVHKQDGRQGFVDVFWPGVMLAEHKSAGRDLDKAYNQAREYLPNLKETELPRYIVVSDFATMRVYDLEENNMVEFPLTNLNQHIDLFGFISGYEVRRYEEEEAASIKAAQLMADFHNSIANTGYNGHNLEVFLTRILFCLFAEDTGIFERKQFQNYIEQRTNDDGSDLGSRILELFYNLNKPSADRQSNLDEQIAAFPYINGAVFAESLDPISLDSAARTTLLECCSFDWSQISAAIFGSLFQGVMDKDERRQLGAHYTSEINIMKVIQPLFLDELYTEFDAAKRSPKKLEDFHTKLTNLKFLDPACGCGNFLVTTYRELRRLEIEILKKKRKTSAATLTAFGAEDFSRLHVNQFYGIEIEEFPALVARTAMYLADHQATRELQKEFGQAIPRIPLEEPATIINANALTLEWRKVVAPSELSYILGNPPFYGARLMTKEQKAELVALFPKKLKGVGNLDFVTGWYVKAADFINGTKIKVGLVSTNSITQGEQVGILWEHLHDTYGVVRHFAHRTFKWKNDAKGNAAVYCVIIGFANFAPEQKYLYEYETITSEPTEREVSNINAYLVDAPEVFIKSRRKPICAVPEMVFGNMANDGGGLIIEDDELKSFLQAESNAKKFIRQLIGAEEYINKKLRWCLWLVDANPTEIKSLPAVLERISKVRLHRMNSAREATKKLATTPMLFGEIRQPDNEYILVPCHSSCNRDYIPTGFISKEKIVTNSCLAIPSVTLYHFGILTSKMHMTWIKSTCGRIKSDYRYSSTQVYNNFPWPGCGAGERSEPAVSDPVKEKIEQCAQSVLDARAQFPDSSLADLYDPRTMPPVLQKAHIALDRAVDQAYNYKLDTNDSEPSRIAFLFDRYQKIVSD